MKKKSLSPSIPPPTSSGGFNPILKKKNKTEEEIVSYSFLLELAEIVGSGGFNCAFKVKDEPYVYRIQKGEGRNVQSLLRSGKILIILNDFRLVLGPCVLNIHPLYSGQLCSTGINPDVVERIKKSECNKPLSQIDNTKTFFEQVVEFAPTGSLFEVEILPQSDEFAFMLLWFFFTSKMLFGFQHRDFKPENVLLKRIEGGGLKLFQFVIEEKGKTTYYNLNSEIIPKVIDFDQSSFYNTSDGYFFPSAYTLIYMPPEVAFQKLTNHRYMDYGTYDYWSIGITLFDLWTSDTNSTHYAIASIIRDVSILTKVFLLLLGYEYNVESNKKLGNSIIVCIVIQIIMHGYYKTAEWWTPIIFSNLDPKETMLDQSDVNTFFVNISNLILDEKKNKLMKRILNRCDTKFAEKPDRYVLLKSLLALDPRERNKGVVTFFEKFKFTPEKNDQEQPDYKYKTTLRSSHLPEFREVESKINDLEVL